MKDKLVSGFRRFFQVIYTVLREYFDDNGPFFAAGIAFYAFFSLFPLTLIAVAILTHLYEGDRAFEYTMELSADFIPEDMVGFLDENLRMFGQDLNTIGLASLVMLLWSGRMLFRAMELSLHKAWDIPLERGVVVGNLLAMLLVILCGAVVFVAGLASIFLNWVQLTLSRLPIPHFHGLSPADAEFWLFIHSWFVVPGATTLIFGLLYIILPSRQVPVRYAVPGAIFSGIAWKVSSLVYLNWVVEFGSKNPLYGSVWGIVGLLVWLYIEASVFLLGAELVYVTLQRRGGKKKRR